MQGEIKKLKDEVEYQRFLKNTSNTKNPMAEKSVGLPRQHDFVADGPLHEDWAAAARQLRVKGSIGRVNDRCR